MSGGWTGSKRHDGLPTWWPATVRRILKRDPACRCTGCPRCGLNYGKPGCARISQAVDHIIRGDDHRDVNLRGICNPCHNVKSSAEGNQAKIDKRKPSGFLAEPHPGKLR